MVMNIISLMRHVRKAIDLKLREISGKGRPLVTVGYKIPTAGTLSGIDYRTAPPGLLREPGSTSDINYRTAPPGLLREPGSASDINYSTAPPGLLREPGSALGVNCW